MTPAELDQIERRWMPPPQHGLIDEDVADLIAALRAAWAERDRLQAELNNSISFENHELCCDTAAEQVRTMEREACAQLAHEEGDGSPTAGRIIAAIRARGGG